MTKKLLARLHRGVSSECWADKTAFFRFRFGVPDRGLQAKHFIDLFVGKTSATCRLECRDVECRIVIRGWRHDHFPRGALTKVPQLPCHRAPSTAFLNTETDS